MSLYFAEAWTRRRGRGSVRMVRGERKSGRKSVAAVLTERPQQKSNYSLRPTCQRERNSTLILIPDTYNHTHTNMYTNTHT